MQFKPCQPYHAVLADKTLLSMSDGKSAFKIYFINLIGRANPSRYEWPQDETPIRRGQRGIYKNSFHPPKPCQSSLAKEDKIAKQQFAGRFQKMSLAGIGFVTAFAHVTKVFRFDPAAETVLDVRPFSTVDLAPLDLKRAEDYLEFACYAEALLAAAEYRLWANAKTVGEYLSAFSSFDDGKIVSNTKLADHFNPPDLSRNVQMV